MVRNRFLVHDSSSHQGNIQTESPFQWSHALKTDLKTKKAELKSIDKEIARIEAKKVKAETKAAESAKKAEAEDVLKKLLASGVSADDILAKLK